jgi:hypothetical protein
MSGPISALVEEAFACMTHEAPVAYELMAQALGARRFELAIDDEHFMLDLGPTALRGAVVSIATDIETLHDLVHGQLDLLDAIVIGRLDVMAGPDDVAAAAAAMTYFVQGAMRCVSMRPLIDRLEGLRKERT